MLSRPRIGVSGYGLVETALVIVVVGALIAVVVDHYARNLKKTRDTAIRSEIATLRNTINIFTAMKGRCPESLREILEANIAVPYRTGPLDVKKDAKGKVEVEEQVLFTPEYLKLYALDGDGNILDPFGLPYDYEPSNCTVRARTPGYEDL